LLELKSKLIKNKLKYITDKTWKGPLNEEPPNMQLTSYQPHDTHDGKKAQFNPTVLPTFRAEDDLEQ